MQLRVLATIVGALASCGDAVQAKVDEPHHGFYAVTSDVLGRLIATLGATSVYDGVSDFKSTIPYSGLPVNTQAMPITTTADISPRAESFADSPTAERPGSPVPGSDSAEDHSWPVFVNLSGNGKDTEELLWEDEDKKQSQAECGCREGTIPRQTVLAIAGVLGTALWGWNNGSQSGIRCCSLLLFLMLFQQRAQDS